MPFGFDPITVASPAFLVLAAAVVASAHVVGGRFFSHTLAATGSLLAASWLTAPHAALLLTSLVTHWLLCHYFWGQPLRATSPKTGLAIGWHVALLCSTKLVGVSSAIGIAGVVGLSYITFRQIELLLEAPRAKSALTLVAWWSFLVNPLTLLAGPVQSWSAHTSGQSSLEHPSYDAVLSALHRLSLGALKILVIAPVFANQHDLRALQLGEATALDWAVTFYSYYIFLFLDFSGYIDIVVGVARLAGFKTFPENFNKPYLAANFQEFWASWNITLGAWFRTYLFTPLLAVLIRWRGIKRQHSSVALALFVTFFVIGLWHGLAWNFVVFGLIHASGVSLVSLTRQSIIAKFGRQALNKYEANVALRVVRVVAFQHVVAGSFLLLDNDLSSLFKLFGGP